MLIIGEGQKASFDLVARAPFLAGLSTHLSRRKPGLLARFPPSARDALVRNMVARAERHGLTWKSTITLFCDLMQSVAPNFDRHPLIRKALIDGASDADVRFRSIFAEVPSDVWDEVARNRVDLPLFTDPEFDGRPLVERVAQAMPVVLWDHIAPGISAEAARWAMRAAANLRLDGLDDAPLAIAAMRVFYPSVSTPERPDWLADIRDISRPAPVRLELLRLRIALDHGRWV